MSEIEKILKMVQEGKIDVEKGTELIEILKERKSEETIPPISEKYSKKMLKIRVQSPEGSDGDNVSINLPIRLVKVLLAAGKNIAGNIPEYEKYAKDINMDIILDAIDNELDGEIVRVNSGDGEVVSILID